MAVRLTSPEACEEGQIGPAPFAGGTAGISSDVGTRYSCHAFWRRGSSSPAAPVQPTGWFC